MTNGTIVLMGRLENNTTMKSLKINNIVASECTLMAIVKCIEVNRGMEEIEMMEVECPDINRINNAIEKAKRANRGSRFKKIKWNG